MPPKRNTKAAKKNTPSPAALKKAAGNARKTKASKKLDDEEDEDDDVDEPPAKITRQDSQNTRIKKAFENLKSEEKQKKVSLRVDVNSPFGASDQVYEDYACMLNQTNINVNNNKFYVIQLVHVNQPKSYSVFTRWGRVGETGQQMTNQFKSVDDAIKEFKKKFKDKTKNDWDDRDNFKPYSKKYTLLEMGEDDDDSDADTKQPQTSKAKIEDPKLICSSKHAKTTLDETTLEFIQRIFDEEMFNNTMQDFSLDIKKMPLGKLSKTQISKGFDVLVALEDCIAKNSNLAELERLSSQFYTLIPHSFGRNRPVVLSSSYLVNQKKEMLLVLSDIELTQSLQKEMDVDKKTGLQPNPWDEKYKVLRCNLSVLPKSSDEYKIIESYFTATSCDWRNVKLKNVWKADREQEGTRFANHEDIKERKLLWHGTNIAVVAAILSSGLRIMPHSGGRVGKGIYFASEHSKSFGYTCGDRKGMYVMFLNEVALGKEHTITADQSNLKAPPAGYDSVVARGSQEPDPKNDAKLSLNGKEVVVPQGKPVKTKFTDSSFNQSEYLVYKESQVRIRYVLAFHCP